MTLDEAIKHCWKRVDENVAEGCSECAEDHERLANWLEELKEWREYGDRVKKAVQAILDIKEVERTYDE